MTLNEALTFAISAVGATIALGTLVKGYREYHQQGQQRRAEMFFALRARLRQDNLARIAELIDLAVSGPAEDAATATARLQRTSFRDKREYLGLFEEVAILMDRGQIEPHIAHYMFGYYALLCQECVPFWNNVNYGSEYWRIYHDFCAAMRRMRGEMLARGSVASDSRSLVISRPNDNALPTARVKIPPVLRHSVGAGRVEVHGETVGEVLAELCSEFPLIRQQVFNVYERDGRIYTDLNRFVNVYVDDEDVRVLEGLDTPVSSGTTITILPAMSGG